MCIRDRGEASVQDAFADARVVRLVAVAGVWGTGAPADALVDLRFAAVAGVLGAAPAVALVDLRLGVAAALGIRVATFFCVCGDSGINVGALGGPSPI